MANVRQPKAKQSIVAEGKDSRSNSSGSPDASTATARTSVSTSEPTITTARNATIQGNAVISSDDVRQKAYELYEKRGRLEGFHEQDWHDAETQLRDSNSAGSHKQGANRAQPNTQQKKKSA